jgi:hypothetical protein
MSRIEQSRRGNIDLREGREKKAPPLPPLAECRKMIAGRLDLGRSIG